MKDGFMVIETSCSHSSITVGYGQTIMDSFSWEADRNQSSIIFVELRKALNLLGNHELKYILVGSGPGAYGSIRVALAVADGLALALDARVYSVCSWEGIDCAQADYWVISNARRGGWAFGHISHGSLVSDIIVLPHEEAMVKLSQIRQNDVPVYSVESSDYLESQGVSDVVSAVPQSSTLAQSWLNKTPEQKESIRQNEPAPLYVRPPHITPAKRPSWAVKS